MQPIASSCLIAALRLLVKLADTDAHWSKRLANTPFFVSLLLRITLSYHGDRQIENHDILSDNHDINATRLDIMCLALALLTSLVLEDNATRSSIFSTRK